MTSRIVVALLLSAASLAHACECIPPPIKEAMKRSDLVFRGTVTGFRDSGRGYQIVTFKVERVWKGRVAAIVEMPAFADVDTSPCAGLWPSMLEAGRDLIVYANRVNNGDLMTGTCTRTSFAKDNADLKALGAGKPPASNRNARAEGNDDWHVRSIV